MKRSGRTLHLGLIPFVIALFLFTQVGCSGSEPQGNCTPGDTQECYTGKDGTKDKGACKAGTSTCDSSGEWGKCEGEVLPTAEACDGEDNNCDGSIDEGLTGEPCAKSKGVCAGLLQQCGGTKGWLKCTDEDYKAHNKDYVTDETGSHCDTQDNDCDGKTDEGCECKDGDTQECGASSQGECKKGTQTCSAGKWGKCEGETKPTPETCDGKDNNCDGKADEGCECKDGDTQECGASSKGECKKGTQTCKAGKWGTCEGEVKPVKETCDGKDNNCDGKADEGCECLDNATRPCGASDTGLCQKGTQTCKAGKWGACAGEVKPAKETCDGKDNNCDGQTDEGCQCKDGQKQACGVTKGECKQGSQTCSAGTWGKCVGEIKPQTETCDGKDNNCDGSIDEGQNKSCKTACGTGQMLCKNGKLEACNAPKPQTETCDGKDNNCNGQIDEGCQCRNGVTKTCGTDKGECSAGKQTCASGKWGACVGEVKPQTETCDGKDNNCDGMVDEGCQCRNGVTQTCGATDKGECKKGTQTCTAGKWGACVGEVKSKAETCDGKDNDCNGQIDNGSNLCPSGQTCQGTKGCQASGPTPILTGTFVNASYKVSGTVAIYKDSQGERVVLGPAFKSDAGPDLKVYLTTDPKGNASVGSFINLGVLQKTSGSQTYRLPSGKSSSGYKAIVIWCQRFSANFGYATLK